MYKFTVASVYAFFLYLWGPPLGVARMTKCGGVGRFGPFQNDRPTGHFPPLLYAERYLNAASLLRKQCANFPIFGLGKPTRAAEQGEK